ncbi:unnamed protein product, partial [Meganyctiphanes norvegica]
GEISFGYRVAYDNMSQPLIIYCDEDVMTSFRDLKTAAAKNCFELQEQGMYSDGPNIIYPYSNHPDTPLLVYCDQTTDYGGRTGGWTVIQRRFDGSKDFLQRLDPIS